MNEWPPQGGQPQEPGVLRFENAHLGLIFYERMLQQSVKDSRICPPLTCRLQTCYPAPRHMYVVAYVLFNPVDQPVLEKLWTVAGVEPVVAPQPTRAEQEAQRKRELEEKAAAAEAIQRLQAMHAKTVHDAESSTTTNDQPAVVASPHTQLWVAGRCATLRPAWVNTLFKHLKS